jgi:hypothetical protein
MSVLILLKEYVLACGWPHHLCAPGCAHIHKMAAHEVDALAIKNEPDGQPQKFSTVLLLAPDMIEFVDMSV